MNVHEITLDVSKEPAHEPSLYIAQGDKNGTTLKVNVYDNGQALTLTSYTVSFCMRSPDAQDYYEVAGTVSGNVATFLIDETYAAGHPGITEIAYINIINGTSNITSSSRLRVVVLPSAKDGVVPAPAYVSEIDQFIEESQERVDEIIEEAEEIIEHGIPLMSATTRGGAKLGTGLEVDANEKLNVTKATTSALGAVKPDGSTITIDNDGTIHGSSSYSLPTMSSSTKGGAKLGNGLNVDGNDKLNLSPATTSAIGGVKADGTSITVDNDGKIHAPYTYTLPAATTSTLGGVKADGSTITVDNDGTIHGASTYTLPPATTSTLGGVKADGTTITVDNDGTIHSAGSLSLPTMSPTTKGGAKLGDGLSVDANDKLNLGSLVKHSTDGTTDGSAIYGVQGEGFAYQDGTPSPSNPQEIKVARGRNLFNPANYLIAHDNDLQSSSSSYYVSISGNTITVKLDSNGYGVDFGLGRLTPGEYVFTCSGDSTGFFLVTYANGFSVGTGKRSPTRPDITNGVPFTITQEAEYGICFWDSAINQNKSFYDLQCEKNQSPTPYVPYGYMGLEVKSGKNLFNENGVWTNGYFLNDSGAPEQNAYYKYSTDYYQISANAQYVFSGVKTDATTSGVRVCFYNSQKAFISATVPVQSSAAGFGYGTFTTPANTAYFRVSAPSNINNMQLEAGSTPTDYEPYVTTTPIPLPSKGFAGAIGDYVDTLEVDSAGGYVWWNNTDETVINGGSGENWYSGTYGGNIVYYLETGSGDSSQIAHKALSTHFIQQNFTIDGIADGRFDFGDITGTTYGPFIRYDAASNLSGFKTWLASNNVTILHAKIANTTESGYIDLPELYEGATVNIPELDNVGVDYWVHGAGEVVDHVSNVYKRVEAALAEIATS